MSLAKTITQQLLKNLAREPEAPNATLNNALRLLSKEKTSLFREAGFFASGVPKMTDQQKLAESLAQLSEAIKKIKANQNK